MGQKADRKRARRAALLVLLLGTLVTSASVLYHQAQRAGFLQERFERLSDRMAGRLQARIRGYEQGLRGTRSAFLALGVDNMTLERFRVVSRSRDPDVEYPGVRGFGYIQRVPAGGEEVFLADMISRGRLDFSIRELTPHQRERFVIIFIEPQVRNQQAVGLDIGSEANRRNAILEAFRSGRATLTHPITLVQASGKVSQGFLLLLPLYPDHQVPLTADEREQVALGAAYSPLVIDEVLADFDLKGEGLALSLQDLGVDGQYSTFFQSDGESPLSTGLTTSRDFQVFGRTWRAQFSALPPFVQDVSLSLSPLLIAAGLLVSMLMALLAYRTHLDRGNQARLRESEERMSLFIEHAPAALAMLDADMNFVAVSRRWISDYGLAGQKIIGRSHYEVFPEISEEWREVHRRALAGQVARADRDMFRRLDGRIHWLRWEVRPWYTVKDEVGGIVIFSEDVTRSKQAEDEILMLNDTLEAQVEERTRQLEQTKRSLRAVLDAVPSMIGYWDRNLINKVANHAYAKWFGVDPVRMPGMHIRDLLGEEIYQQNLPYIEGVLSGERQIFQRAIPRPDGKGVRYSLAYYIPDKVGHEVCGFHVIVHDVTELTESRERLAATLRENEMLLHSIDKQLIYSVTDAQGRILSVNDKFCEVSGYAREQLLGRDHRMLSSGQHDAAFWQAMWAEVSAGRAWRGDVCNRSSDGELFWVDSVIAPLVGADGSIERIVALRYDITISRHALQALQEAKLTAERASQAKSAFLANTSHEIRTPLHAIIGMAYLLEQTTLTPDQRQQLTAIQQASRTLLELINDLLDLAKIEAGELNFETRCFALADTISELRQLFRAQADTKGLKLRFQALPEHLPASLIGDEFRLRQVLTNLLSNAIKFTAAGEVQVSMQLLERGEDSLRLRFEVLDSGEGIEPEQVERLFRPFSQADGSITRRHGGTGLGLSIVRQLVEGMGGQVGVSSTPGEGSLFWVELPFQFGERGGSAIAQPDSAEQPMPLEGHRWLPGVRVLVVDDSPLNLDVCRRILELQGAEVSLCLDGKKALDILRRSPDHFDVVLMDVQMPVMDGFSATRRIREDVSLPDLPVIALTAGVSREQVEKALAAGMNRVLGKPVEPQELVRSIRTCVESHWGCRLPVERLAATEQEQAGLAASLPQIEGLEAEAAIRRLHCDPEFYRGMLQRFVEGHRQSLESLNGLLGAQQLTEARALVHRLRGVIANLGGQAVAEAAGRLEDVLAAGEQPSVQQLEPFTVGVERLMLALDQWLQQPDEDAAVSAEAAGKVDQQWLDGRLAELERQLRDNLLSASALSDEIAARLDGTELAAAYAEVSHAVSTLCYKEALQALASLRERTE